MKAHTISTMHCAGLAVLILASFAVWPTHAQGAHPTTTREADAAVTRNAPSATAQDAAAPQSAEPVRRALLIGINAYTSRSVPKLRGCVNDVEAMRAVLTGRFHFDEANIRVLTDAAATRAAILAALDELVDTARPEDFVFLHYAGHGSQVADSDGDEEDGKDETLLPCDARTGDVADITDDELSARLARLRAQSAVIALDCCHSGTGTRSVAVQARRVDEDPRAELYKRNDTQSRAIVPVPSERYVVMTGAADHESALDGPVDGRYRGAFSYALVRTLSSAPADVAPRIVMQGVEREMRRLGEQWMIASMPEPQLEAPAERLDASWLPMHRGFEKETVARVAWTEVVVDPETRTASIDARALGAERGAAWALYPPKEMKFASDGAYALAEVVDSDGARARLSIEPASANVVSGSRAVLTAPPSADEEIHVRLSGWTAEELASLEADLRSRVSGLRVVGQDDPAQLHVQLDGRRATITGADGVSIVASFELADSGDAGEKLAAVIQRCLDAAALVALDNPSSAIELEVEIGTRGRGVQTKIGTRGFKVTADSAAPVFHFKSGDRSAKNSLQLGVRASADCYLTIVDVDAEGNLNLLFPNAGAKSSFLPEGRIAAGTWQLIPDSLESSNRAGFWWDAGPPAGIDTIRVFASTDLAFAEELRDALRKLAAGSTSVAGRGATPDAHSARRAGLGALKKSVVRRGFQVVSDGAPSAESSPAAPGTTGTDTAGASGTDLAGASGNSPADWTAASLTVRIES